MKKKIEKIYKERFDYDFCCGGDYCEGGHDEDVKKDILEFADDLASLFLKEYEKRKVEYRKWLEKTRPGLPPMPKDYIDDQIESVELYTQWLQEQGFFK